MKLTKNYFKKSVKEIIPLVEEISKLECNLKRHSFHLDCKAFQKNEFALAKYSPSMKNISILKNFPGNSDTSKCTIGHELMHNAQYSTFPILEGRINVFNFIWKKSSLSDSPLIKLIEGDATFVERKLSEKYFKNLRWEKNSIVYFGFDETKSENYLSWEKILREKFNGNRKDINELYTAPIKELVKIFGGVLK